LRKEDLELFFKRDFMAKPFNEGEWRITNRILERVGWVPGLLKRLATSETGIIGDDNDLKRRTKLYSDRSKNIIIFPSLTSFVCIVLVKTNDQVSNSAASKL
jgi:hypothetical protein